MSLRQFSAFLRSRGILKLEEWKNIKGYEGLYQISSRGRVKSVEKVIPHKIHGEWHLKEKILKSGINGAGYCYVILFDKDKKQNNLRIHRLVAEHFLEEVDGNNTVNHKDCNRLNNNIENLEWCSDKENSVHAWSNGRCEKIRDKTYCEKKCMCVETGTVFNSVKEAGGMFKRAASNVSKACKHGTSCAGVHFKYI